MDLHSLHGQFSVCYFLIVLLEVSNDVSFLNSLGTIFQISGPRYDILSFPQKPHLKFGKLSCENCCKLSLLSLRK